MGAGGLDLSISEPPTASGWGGGRHLPCHWYRHCHEPGSRQAPQEDRWGRGVRLAACHCFTLGGAFPGLSSREICNYEALAHRQVR